MNVGLFIPCYIDQFYPHVGMATVDLLERLGVRPVYPLDQTCCGQPMTNTGCIQDAVPLIDRFAEVFSEFDHIVCPSGSCTAMVRCHYPDYSQSATVMAVARKTYELSEFLADVLELDVVPGRFPARVGLHASCHGLRELRLGSDSERVSPEPFNKTRQFLEGLDGLQLVQAERADECCGFGGTFAVSQQAVSASMGWDRIDQFLQAGAQVITSGDMSCLMHLAGLIKRKKSEIRVMHFAEILNEATSG